MRVVAQQGRETDGFGPAIIIETRQDYGFVYDMGQTYRFEEQFIHSIFARGYWYPPTVEVSDEELERIAALPIML